MESNAYDANIYCTPELFLNVFNILVLSFYICNVVVG